MTDRAVPPLALTLAAVTADGLRLEDGEAAFGAAFVPAVAGMDDADRAYRRAIETTLPRELAGTLLSAMASFRERVHDSRERARKDIAQFYARAGRSYGWFDPLDAYVPPVHGLSHADGTRVATVADEARATVASLRARVNELVAQRLAPAQIEALIAAKRRRREAFEAVLERSLQAALAPHPTVTRAEAEKTLYRLAQLAEGWY